MINNTTDNRTKPERYLDAIGDLAYSKPVKIIITAGVVIGLLYVAGHVFRITAGTVLGYKKLQRAIKL